jgi:hypothetical protein
MSRSLPFLASERSRAAGVGAAPVSDGSYKVLATLVAGAKSYRILAEMVVEDEKACLRFYRFDVPPRDEWFAERKINLPIARPEIAPLKQHVAGAEFVLCAAVCLEESEVEEIFGASGPPVT